MSKLQWLAALGLVAWLTMAPAAQAQVKSYIGFVYPAGGRQGTTFRIKLGGQGLDDVNRAIVSGTGVTAKIIEYHRKLGPQDIKLLREQLKELRQPSSKTAMTKLTAPTKNSDAAMMAADNAMMAPPTTPAKTPATGSNNATQKLIEKLEARIAGHVQRPACSSLANLVFAEVTIAPDAALGERELRLVTPQSVSNPLVFHVGQVPEVSRKPMTTCAFQVLGKEELALRKRPNNEAEDRIKVPCTVNGQIASGEVNRYRFEARKGQRLVISTQARQLIPYIADAVPGWLQPVLALSDANGKEMAYDDDYRFKPDPVIFFVVPKDGEYVFTIADALYRGREDFVYRVTIGELPFVTSIFPLGGQVGVPTAIQMRGWNLNKAALAPPAKDAGPGIHLLAANKGRLVSNRMPFALDTLPECFDKEPNNDPPHAQRVTLPIIVNGRIDRPDDGDVFQFAGRTGDTVVAEVYARRLDSPLDSVLKLTDANGKVLAYNDDHEDAESGINTHHADSYLTTKLPADGTYYVHLGDTNRMGGEAYAYRLRISAPQPDFALRIVPSSVGIRSKNSTAVSVHALRKDGFNGPIKLQLKNPPAGFSLAPDTISGTQEMTRFSLKTNLTSTQEPVTLTIEGRATIAGREVVHEAVPAEDRMQAFLWRHLAPAQELKVAVVDPSYESPAKRVRRIASTAAKPAATSAKSPVVEKPKFTKKQVAGRLRDLQLLFEEGLLTDEFYEEKIEECKASQ